MEIIIKYEFSFKKFSSLKYKKKKKKEKRSKLITVKSQFNDQRTPCDVATTDMWTTKTKKSFYLHQGVKKCCKGEKT